MLTAPIVDGVEYESDGVDDDRLKTGPARVKRQVSSRVRPVHVAARHLTPDQQSQRGMETMLVMPPGSHRSSNDTAY